MKKCDSCGELQTRINGGITPLYEFGKRWLCSRCGLNSIPAHQGWAHVPEKLPANGHPVRLNCPQCGRTYDSDEWVGGDMCCLNCSANACHSYADVGYYREGGEPYGRIP